MLTSIPNLTWLRTFESAARLLSFTEAGREIGMTQAAVSQQIKALESKVGCDLFVRHHRILSLTDMGRAYLPAVQKALGDLALSTNGLFGPGFEDLITVRAPVSTAILWLAPKLHSFRAAHPGTRIRLVSSFWDNNPSGERVDVEIRLGYGNWDGLQAEKLSSETLVPICPVGQASHYQTAAAFLETSLIHIIGSDDNWTHFFDAHDLTGYTGRFGVSVDTTAAAVDLVATGAGCAMVLGRFANAALHVGRTIELAGDSIGSPQSHYLVTPHSESGESQMVLEFKEWIKQEMI
jgi:LysR family glycine cleavage system transcriptional activator